MSLVVLAGCASDPVQLGVSLPAPNPNGCYVFVYDRAAWQGARVLLNGPDKWSTLERVLLNNEDWRNRIRSMDVGPRATVTVYTERRFMGVSRRFGPGGRVERLDGQISANIESLDLTCAVNTQ
jgi:hypothetical protein